MASSGATFSPTDQVSEATAFLTNIDNYLPLGCLTYGGYDNSTTEDYVGKWRDITNLPNLIPAHIGLLRCNEHLRDLAAAGWIRIWSTRCTSKPSIRVFRVYILPFDVGRRFVDREQRALRPALRGVLSSISVNPDTWQGGYGWAQNYDKFDKFATAEGKSLYWMFNKLKSPDPEIDKLERGYAREALEDLLDASLPGLSTDLYPYQRRSAGMMLQRESVTSLDPDPRIESRAAPDGTVFFYGARDSVFLRHPRYYEAPKGGVLAESMGLGKTLICLALVLSTKGHPPKVPARFAAPPTRFKVGSLTQMAISKVHLSSIPWQVEFDRLRHATGEGPGGCLESLRAEVPFYRMPSAPLRTLRSPVTRPPRDMILAATTLIIVPQNLCKQWQSEIMKHLTTDAMSVLVMEDPAEAIPPPEELRHYDIVLFTRRRFELEIKNGTDARGRRIGPTSRLCRCPYIGASRVRDCDCIRQETLYDSPLAHLHVKRLIIDEGHFVANVKSQAVTVATTLITADHRWVVSGTPSRDLLGVEVDTSAKAYLWSTPDTSGVRDALLRERESHNRRDDMVNEVKGFGDIATHYLMMKPWVSPGPGEYDHKAGWMDYIFRHEHPSRKTYSGYSRGFRRTLESMVVKTRPEDVERDIDLPPLSHKVVKLEPSFYDKLTANLFTLVLTANAVTSERIDVDYLFHKKSQQARHHLIANLRQSAFFWTGFSANDVEASRKSSEAYLEKEDSQCSDADRKLLSKTLACVDTILDSDGWRSMSRSHEMGLFVDHWPEQSADHWAFDASQTPLMTGITQLLRAQKYVNDRAEREDPGEGLSGEGINAMAPVKQGLRNGGEVSDSRKDTVLTKAGIPVSSIDGEPTKRKTPQKAASSSKNSSRKKGGAHAPNGADADVSSSKKRSADEDNPAMLPAHSPLRKARIIGTTSAKLSYLISQILQYHREEKIICFYDGDNAAFYIAQALDLFHIPHEIYAKSLTPALKAEYVVRFNQEPHQRVLLMDIHNAAFGLNMSAASRIYFVNPVCRPNIEAQAIKRAHRIGQTRKVHVETLVLKDTIEEKMLERSQKMTRVDHQAAKHLEDDDAIRSIIESARVMPIRAEEKHGRGRMAALDVPQQLWGREGRNDFHLETSCPNSKRRKTEHEWRDVEMSSYGVCEMNRSGNVYATAGANRHGDPAIGSSAGGALEPGPPFG